ncbi:MAG TPA: metallophosphoesterase [Candidatus Acidoferrum sp.]|nr:metallophosphoesterase [Candidatus Acidoferrum sp.]
MPRKAKAPLPQPMFSEPVFNENGAPTPDPTTFRTNHDPKVDNQLYKQVQALLTKDTVNFDPARGNPGDVFSLASALGSQGPADVAAIQKAGQIVFHAIGDSGASSLGKLVNEENVADLLTNDFHISTGANRPAFLFHLGDIIYNFGEPQYYYDQFYEPFRNYPAPILAVPGNHDSFVIPGTTAANTPLKAFTRNFCATSPVVTAEAGSLHRTAMTQPGVYFALDAPFVRIIGLFSNALEDPGLISSQKGQKTAWPGVPDTQLAFLTAQLKNIKAQNYTGAVLIAVHHPPFSYATSKGGGGTHLGNTLMLREIDTICQAQGVYPHAFLSGHAHNYQRYTRKLSFAGKNYSVPFIVAGDGGFNVKSIVYASGGSASPPPAPGTQVNYLDPNPVVKATGLTIAQYDQTNYGYLRIIVNSAQLRIEFRPVSKGGAAPAPDIVKVDLATHTVVP